MWTARLKNVPGDGRHAVAIGGKIYVIHSYRRGEPIYVCRFDPTTFRWDTVHTPCVSCVRPKKIAVYTIVGYGHCAYLWGGMDDGEPDNAVYSLDTNTMTWSRPQMTGEVPRSVIGHSACVIGHCMYIFGGWTMDSPERVRFLDLTTMQWHGVDTGGEVPPRLKCHTACAIGSRMYVWGGMDNGPMDGTTCANSLYYLETTSSTWVRPHVEGVLPEGRYCHSSFVHRGNMYIFGGNNGDLRTRFVDVHRYDPMMSRWTVAAGDLPGPRTSNFSSCCVIDDRAFVINDRHRLRRSDNKQIPESYSEEVPSNLYVLDLAPSLKTRCLMAFLDARLDVTLLPPIIRNEICGMIADGSTSSVS